MNGLGMKVSTGRLLGFLFASATVTSIVASGPGYDVNSLKPETDEVFVPETVYTQVYEEEGYEDSGYDHGGYNHHGSKYEDHEAGKHVEAPERRVDSGEITDEMSTSDVLYSSANEPQGAIKRKSGTIPDELIRSSEELGNGKRRNTTSSGKSKDPALPYASNEFSDSSIKTLVKRKPTFEQGNRGRQLRRADLEMRRPNYGVQSHRLAFVPFPFHYAVSPTLYAANITSQKTAVKQVNLRSTSTAPPTNKNARPVNILVQQAPRSKPESAQKYASITLPKFNSSEDIGATSSRSEELEDGTTSRSFLKLGNADDKQKRCNNLNRTSSYCNSADTNSKRRVNNPNSQTMSTISIPWESSELLSPQHPYSSPGRLRHDPVKYIEQLTASHFANAVNVPMSHPLVQNERLKELAAQLNAQSESFSRLNAPPSVIRKKRVTLDDKYPFYNDFHGIHRNSALRYASNPAHIIKKTEGKMAFYESKDRLAKCPEPQLRDDIVPKRAKDGAWNPGTAEQPELPRITKIGQSIKCLKAKYFGKEPLDSPFFKEEESPQEDDILEFHREIDRLKRKTRAVGSDQVMVFASQRGNLPRPSATNYTDSRKIRVKKNDYVSFPFKNHKPETASVSPSVQNIRATTFPYNYDGSQFAMDNTGEESQRQKYYHRNYTRTVASKTKKRRRHPISIYSIVSGSGHYPGYRRPVSYTIPMYIDLNNIPNDAYASSSKNNFQTAPTRWYIIRPGEYTENKNLIADSKPASSSIWDYINPLRWWFPSYFDSRRGEPKYYDSRSIAQSLNSPNSKETDQNQRRRNSEQKLLERTSMGTYNASLDPQHRWRRTTDREPFVSKSMRINSTSIGMSFGQGRENRILASTESNVKCVNSTFGQRMDAPPIALKALEPNSRITPKDKPKSIRVSHFLGGFVLSNTPSSTYSIQAPTFTNAMTPSVYFSTTPMSPSNEALNSPKIKQITKLRYQTVKAARKPENKMAVTATTTPSTTTFVLAPTRTVSDRNTITTSTIPKPTKPPSSVDYSSITDSKSASTDEEPRKLPQLEHRQVTEEEIIKTSFMSEGGEIGSGRDGKPPLQPYLMSSFKRHLPAVGSATKVDAETETLSYMIDPVTGIGRWIGHPQLQRPSWNSKRWFLKRRPEELAKKTPRYNHSVTRSFEEQPRGKYRTYEDLEGFQHLGSISSKNPMSHDAPPGKKRQGKVKYASRLSPQLSSQQEKEATSLEPEKTEHLKSKATPRPLNMFPSKVILDPEKRKYFYAKHE